MRPRVVLDYAPTRLAEVRQQVVLRHPSTADAPASASETRLEELHDRLLALSGSAVGLRRLADGLTGREIHGIARSLGRWDDVRPAITTIVQRRMRRSLLRTLWLTWEEHPDVPDVAELCAEIGGQYGWDRVAGEGMETEVSRWVRARPPGESIRSWLDTQGLTYSDLSRFAQSPLRSNTTLSRTVRDAVMTGGSLEQLRAEGPGRLLGWLPELSPEDQQRFGRHYLTTLDVKGWEAPVLETIKEKYGSPRRGRSAFWDPIPQSLRDAFLRWFLQRKIDEVFSGDSDRHRYWSSKIPQLVDIETGNAGGTEYAWLVFEGFAVVEFFELANAAYFYPRDQARRLQATRPTHPRDLKNRETVRIGMARSNNWLIHGQNWQRRADRYIQLWSRLGR